MAVEQKRKVGRPPKNKPVDPVVNEQVECIRMTEDKDDKKIVLTDIQQKWREILHNYSDRGLSMTQISSALSNAMLNNPFLQNQRLRRISSNASAKSKTDLQKALQSPQGNEQLFREESLFLSFTNYVYHSLLNLYRDIPLYNYYYTPKYVDKKDMSGDNFKKESKKVDKILKAFKVKQTFKKINKATQVEGKTTWLLRRSMQNNGDIDFFVLQKLDSDMVKLTSMGSDQNFICSFNFMIFLNPMYSLEFYPPIFKEIFQELLDNGIITEDSKGNLRFSPQALALAQSEGKLTYDGTFENSNNNYLYWVQLPQTLAWTFSQDESHVNAFPDTIGLFMDLSELDGYRWIQSSILSNVVSSILTAEVPYIKDAQAGSDASVFSPDSIIGFENLFKQNVSNMVLPFFAPFENYKLFTIENQPENLNIIYSRLRDLVATSGTSSLLGITEKPTVAMTVAAKQLAASHCDYLTRQFENFLNYAVNNKFNLKYDWKITLWGDIYHWRDDLKIAKELLSGGVTSVLPKILSAEDMSLEDCICTSDYIDSLGIQFNAKEEQTNNPVGRPTLDDDQVQNDNTAISKDAGNNVSENKEFSVNINLDKMSVLSENFCASCGKKLENNEEFLCDLCLEEQISLRKEEDEQNELRMSRKEKN